MGAEEDKDNKKEIIEKVKNLQPLDMIKEAENFDIYNFVRQVTTMLREFCGVGELFLTILMNPGPILLLSGGGVERYAINMSTLSQIAETARVGDVLPRS